MVSRSWGNFSGNLTESPVYPSAWSRFLRLTISIWMKLKWWINGIFSCLIRHLIQCGFRRRCCRAWTCRHVNSSLLQVHPSWSHSECRVIRSCWSSIYCHTLLRSIRCTRVKFIRSFCAVSTKRFTRDLFSVVFVLQMKSKQQTFHTSQMILVHFLRV